MRRDPFFQSILDAMSRSLDPEVFEACVCDLLRPDFPSLVPIRGGSDSGMDGAIADGEGPAYPITCTTSSDVIGNFSKSLNSYLNEGGQRRKVVVATSNSLTPIRKRNLEQRARNLGFTLVQIYDKEAIADRLYHSPKWCLELLNLTGNAPILSPTPRTTRPLTGLELIAREDDLAWLRKASGNVLLVGQPGSGKTSLLHHLTLEGNGLFLVGEDIPQLASELREKRPKALYLDDAHVEPDRLVQLIQMRRELQASFSIVATVWPGGRDEVVEKLGVPPSHIRKLELLTREQIVQVLRGVGLIGSNALLREIVDQARGLPGLAVTLAELCRQEGVGEVTLGTALKRSVHVSLEHLVGKLAIEVLSCFAIGGDHGMNHKVVARVLEMTAHELRRIVAGLEASGVVTDLGEGVLAVYPVALRHALVRDMFFSGPVPLNPGPLMESARSAQSVAETLIGARAGGATLTDDYLWPWLERSLGDTIWMHYASLGRKETLKVLQHKPDRLLTIASVGLQLSPAEIIPRLLWLAVSDPRDLDPYPQHPLRIIRDWIHGAKPGQAETLGNRKTLHKEVLAWLDRGGEASVGFRAFLMSFDPSVEWTEADPGAGGRFSLFFGYLSPEELDSLGQFWSKNIALMPAHADDSWNACLRVLHAWAHPMPPKGPETDYFRAVQAAMKRVAVGMIQDFARLAVGRWGVLHALSEQAQRLGVELPLTLDPDYEIIHPTRPWLTDDWKEAEDRQVEEATKLGERWVIQEPGVVARRLAALATEAHSVNHTYPDHSIVVCRKIAEATHRPLDWIRALEEVGCHSAYVDPFLRKLVQSNSPEWIEVAAEYLERPSWMYLVAELVLSNPEHSADALSLVLKKLDARWSQLVYVMALRNQLPERVQLHLLTHDNDVVAGSVAVGAWGSNPKGSVPESLQDAWRQAILRCTASTDLDLWLGQVLQAEPELAHQWLAAHPTRMLDSAYDLQFLAAATSGLTTAMRTHLLEFVSPATWRSDVISILVGSDLDAYKYVLDRPDWKWMHLGPITWPDQPNRDLNVPDLNQVRLAKSCVAMSHGYSAEEVVFTIFHGPGPSWRESSLSWQAWVEAFQKLQESEDPSVNSLGVVGVEMANLNKDRAVQEERHRAVFGGW